MKIAVCLSGHVRNMVTIPIIEQLQSRGINYDVYISSWNTTGKWLEPTKLPYNEKVDGDLPRLGIYEHERKEINTDIFNSIKNIAKLETEDDTKLIDEILDLAIRYKDVIEPGQFDMDREEQRKYQIFSMFRKCQRSIDLIDSPEQYDLILRTRFDAVYNLDLVINNINHILENDVILIPSNFEFGGEKAEGGGRVCDSFALGSPKNMTKYAKIYDFLKNENTLQFLKDNDIWFCPHSLLRQHLLQNDVKYHRSEISYDIIRDSDRVASVNGYTTYTGQFSDANSIKSIWNKK